MSQTLDNDPRLRKVERDIYIPKMMKKAAIRTCSKEAQAFAECCHGRTISMAWACNKQNNALQNCLKNNLLDADYEREKAIFLRKKEETQMAESTGFLSSEKS
eukprot:m.304899 g.304899  ORF g.304899 m.304899 type:complete len:103 (-) comp16443_c0_seq1:680-988(-)